MEGRIEEYSPDQDRDESGKWTDGGAGPTGEKEFKRKERVDVAKSTQIQDMLSGKKPSDKQINDAAVKDGGIESGDWEKLNDEQKQAVRGRYAQRVLDDAKVTAMVKMRMGGSYKDVKKFIDKRFSGEAAESAPASANAAVLRPGVKTTSESIRETTSGARILEAADAPANSPDGGPRNVRCQIIREGLGNRVDMHYYGPQSIRDIGRLINGAKCFINHPTKSEATDQPEGNIWAECGYWKDGVVVEVDGKLAVQATLVCDDTEAGKQAMGKAKHSLKYAADFPGLTEVYAGLSINGGGDIAPADMNVDGTSMRVELVSSVTQLPRVDMVTRPAREGKVLGLVESEKIQEGKSTMMKTMIEAMAKYFAGLKLLASAKPDVQAIGKIVEEGEAAVAAMKTKAEEDEAAEVEAEAARRKEAECKNGDGGEVPPEGGEPVAKPGAVSQVRIKHEETRTTRQAEARIIDLEKKLTEANAKLALGESKKQIDDAGVSESLTPEMLSAITDPAARVAVFAIAKKLHESNPFGIGSPARGANGSGDAATANAFVEGLADRLNRRG